MRIKINGQPKHQHQTFVELLPSNPIYKLGEKFEFVDFGSDEYVCNAYLVKKDTLLISELNEFHSFLDKNCGLDIYKTIINQNFKKWMTTSTGEKKVIYFDFLLFTVKSNIKDLNIVEPYFYKK
ncbi:hypothetical protein [uncultured Winogradskyella sp.]|uniref:hypothetical protein n=1 Tax=uncultured Winogradskyella sp. TaxID=395353 RepID=UPI0026292AF3|nr:hypothetical protein [uncultured Winogradskyella sp.]